LISATASTKNYMIFSKLSSLKIGLDRHDNHICSAYFTKEELAAVYNSALCGNTEESWVKIARNAVIMSTYVYREMYKLRN